MGENWPDDAESMLSMTLRTLSSIGESAHRDWEESVWAAEIGEPARLWGELGIHRAPISVQESVHAQVKEEADNVMAVLGSYAQPPTDPRALARTALNLTRNLAALVERMDSVYSATTPEAFSRDAAWHAYRVRVSTALAARAGQERSNAAVTLALSELERLRQEREAIVAHIRELHSAAEKYAAEAGTSAEKAAIAAGKSGAATLSKALAKYSEDQLGSAQRYRIATLSGLGVIIGAAVLLFIPTLFGAGFHWEQLSVKLAVVLALSAATAYLGRQAARHQRLGDWAGSLEVQLRSFPAFVDQVKEPAAVAELYANFSRRMLAAPPEGQARAASNDTQTMQLLLDLVKATKP